MGLLDWTDADDDVFPNFDNAAPSHSRTSSNASSCQRPGSSSSQPATHSASTSTLASTSTSRSGRPRPTRTASGSSTTSVFRHGRQASASFDLFGDDDELQSAEARIGFCDICLKHCDVH